MEDKSKLTDPGLDQCTGIGSILWKPMSPSRTAISSAEGACPAASPAEAPQVDQRVHGSSQAPSEAHELRGHFHGLQEILRNSTL
jgi:hypothetical protein